MNQETFMKAAQSQFMYGVENNTTKMVHRNFDFKHSPNKLSLNEA